MRNSRRALLLAALAALALILPGAAQAQLAGTDTSPGESCAGFPAGATRVTADADQDGAQVVLICDGSVWNAMASGGGGGAAKNLAQLTTTNTTLNINQASAVAIPWDSQLYLDSGYTHSTGTNPERITFVSAGTYLVSVTLAFEGAVQRSNPGVKFRLNGTVVLEGHGMSYLRALSGHDEASATLTRMVDAAAGDYLEVITQEMAAAGTTTLRANESILFIEQLDAVVPLTESLALNELTDVNTGGAADGDCLAYNNATGDWEGSTCGGGAGNPAGATTQLQFNSAGAFGADANFVFDPATGNVGIGTDDPNNNLEVYGDDSVTSLKVINVSSSAARYPYVTVENYKGSTNGGSMFTLRNARGTGASPAALQSGDWIGAVSFSGAYDTGWGFGEVASISATASENLSASGYGGYLAFNTTAHGSTSSTERMRITQAGNVGIGAVTPNANLHIQKDTNGMVNVLVQNQDTGASAGTRFSLSNGPDWGTFYLAGAGAAWRNMGLVTNAPNGLYITQSADSGDIVFETGSSPTARMIIQNGGNVGIGTTNPNQGKVEVKGGSVCVDTNSDNNASSCIASESDLRLKKNVQDLDYSLDTLMQLRPVSFDWRHDDPEVLKHYDLISRFAGQPHSIGLIAQDVQKLVPEAIEQETVGDEEVQYLQLDYTKLVPVVIKAMQEQQAEIRSLKAEISDLETRLQTIEARQAQ